MNNARRLVRSSALRAWTRQASLTVLGRTGRALRFDDASADLALAVIEHLSVPRTRDEVLAHVEALSGEKLSSHGLVDQLLAVLVSVGALQEAPEARVDSRALTPRRVVLAVSGAVAAAHAPMLLTLMLHERWDVRLCATENALRFVAREALEAIAHAPLMASHWQRDDRTRAHHIELAEWAEMVLVYPTSATTLSRIARGDCSDLVSATAIATRAPVVLVPSMNVAMYASPSVQRNLAQLRDDGFHLVLPAVGVEVAHAPSERAPMFGPAPPPEDIVALAKAVLFERDSAGAALPEGAPGWDTLHRSARVGELPWFIERPEDDLAATLDAIATRGARALDIGTGPGTLALHLAALGCQVVATELTESALTHAKSRPHADAVEWRVDDISASTLDASFEIVTDRGCLHVLPREAHERWRVSVRRLTAPGSRIVLIVHDPSESIPCATHGYDEAGLRAFVGEFCDEVRVAPTVMRGPRGVARRAWRCVARVR